MYPCFRMAGFVSVIMISINSDIQGNGLTGFRWPPIVGVVLMSLLLPHILDAKYRYRRLSLSPPSCQNSPKLISAISIKVIRKNE